MPQNLLGQETSPYLLQHKDNPVHWHPWNDDALARAKTENKPILLSIGYAACHWCHVMAHESFESDEIAEVMNAHFVNIKVDREERPDLDNIYQSALGLMGEHGGWPLTMFLTPDGEPFWGGTYFPPAPRYGRPGFTQVLESISHTYRTDPEKVLHNAQRLHDALRKIARPDGGGDLTLDGLDSTASLMMRLIDPINGGTHGAPKFPQSSFFQAIWRAYLRTKGPLFREAVISTMTKICQGGIYDHVGGGLARYATDMHWLIPHFEKMLYDNALLVELLSEVYPHQADPLFAARVHETVAWVLRDMRSGDGDHYAFVSAFDADSEGVEGKYYVWTDTEIDALLGDDSEAFKWAYDVTSHGNWEGHTILNRSHTPGLGSPEEEEKLKACREILLKARAQRVPPTRDDKVLADWNGLMIAALARASSVFGEPSWLEAAKTAFAFIQTEMQDDGRLYHSWCQGRAAHPAVLDDYANMSHAALALHLTTGDVAYLSQAQAWVRVLDTHYWDAEHGGYFLAADDTSDLITRAKTHHDNATPAGNGIAAGVLAKLYHLTGDVRYRDQADRLLHSLVAKETQEQIHQSTLLMAFEMLENTCQVVLIGDPADATTQEFRTLVLETGDPRVVLSDLGPGADLPEGHPAHGKSQVDGGPTAYVCIGTTCSLPITSAAALHDALNAA